MLRTKENNQCFKIISLFKTRISTVLLQCSYCIRLPKLELKIIQVIGESLY